MHLGTEFTAALRRKIVQLLLLLLLLLTVELNVQRYSSPNRDI